MLELWFGFRLWIKLELVLGVFGLKLPLVLRFGLRVGLGLVYWFILGFGQGQGEKGGRVGVWSGVLSWVSPSKLVMSDCEVTLSLTERQRDWKELYRSGKFKSAKENRRGGSA